MSEIKIGDPVYYKDNKNDIYVIIWMENRETFMHLSYDRTYYLESLKNCEDYLNNHSALIFEESSLESLLKVNVQGTSFLPFSLVEGIVPFKTKKVINIKYQVERKIMKTFYE